MLEGRGVEGSLHERSQRTPCLTSLPLAAEFGRLHAVTVAWPVSHGASSPSQRDVALGLNGTIFVHQTLHVIDQAIASAVR